MAGAATTLAGCINFDELSATFDGGNTGPAVDLSGTTLADLAGTAVNCPAGFSDTQRTPDSFSPNTATYYSQNLTFVCRDNQGLYALTAVCTHMLCPVDVMVTGGFHCNCHGSTYDFNGNVVVGPATMPLLHYGMCLSGNRTVGYDIGIKVDAAVRYRF